MLDPTTDIANPESPAPPDFRWRPAHTVALVVLCLTQLLEALDITVVNVALPTLRTELGFSATSLQWVVNAYTVLFGGFLLLGGRAGDLLGRKRVFLAGTVLFTVASLGSGLAQSAGMLVGTRAVQGLAAGFVSPMTLAILAAIFPEGAARTRALTIWGTVTAVSGSLGLALGGALVNGPGWRWIFFVNLPVGALVLAAALRFLPDDRPARRHHGFDAVGALAVTAGVALAVYAAAQTGDHAWTSARTVGLFTAAAALLAYFAVHEARIAAEPLVPLSLFRIGPVVGANVVQLLNAAAMYAVFFFMSLSMQEVLRYSALRTGLAFLPLTGTLVLFAGLGPALVRRFGIRLVVAAGALIAAGGLLMFAHAAPGDGLLTGIVVPSVIVSFGFSLLFVPVTVAAVAGVPAANTGVASGLLNVTRTAGGALGLAVISSVAASRTGGLLAAGHPSNSALYSGFRLGYVISAGLMALSVLTALTLFREQGRGERIDPTALATGGIQ